jgi:hypothetical protein
MDKLLKNLTSILLIATFAFVGYYLYSQQKTSATGEGAEIDNSNFIKAEAFLRDSEVLRQVAIERNITMFSEPNFRALDYDRIPLQNDTTGRPNPFDQVFFSNPPNPNQ